MPHVHENQSGRRPHSNHTVLSCYAPTLVATQDEKADFYEYLSRVSRAVSHKDKLFVIGDFCARVGHDYNLRPKVIGHHGIGKENSSSMMLLQYCDQSLVVKNTVFQQADRYQAHWMHLSTGTCLTLC